MKKIDFIIGSLTRGGAEHVISILANYYCDLGYDVNIVLLLHGDIGYEINPNVKIVHLYGTTSNRLLRIPFWIRALKKHFSERKPDYVVSFVCRINLLTLYALNHCKGLSKPRIIISERNDPRYDGRGIIAKFLSKIYYPYSDSVVVQSKEIQSLLPKNVRPKSCIILNPIDIKTRIIDANNRENIIISNGRLTKQKNHILLIKAFEKLINKNLARDYVLHIYGSGELRSRLVNYIKNHKLDDRIFIFDNTPHVQEKVSKSKFFVLSSKYEGLSNSLMEAVALGIPSISTPVSGSSSIIDSSNGVLLKSFSLLDVSKALLHVINLSDLEYEKLSRGSVEKSSLFLQEKILLLYNNVIIGKNTKK